MFASSSDSAGLAGFVLSAGSKIAFVGLLARSPYTHDDVSTAQTFGGVASINDGAIQGAGGRRGSGIVRKGGTLRVYPENLRLPHVSR